MKQSYSYFLSSQVYNSQKYSGPDFTGLSFSSTKRGKNTEGYLMPDHYVGVTGTPKIVPMGKSTKFD